MPSRKHDCSDSRGFFHSGRRCQDPLHSTARTASSDSAATMLSRLVRFIRLPPALAAFLVCAVAAQSSALAAEIGDTSGPDACTFARGGRGGLCQFMADYTGDVAIGDDVKLEQFVAEKRGEHPPTSSSLLFTVRLDSAGGDVATALKVGRYLRDLEATVVIPPWAHCASSCVFILAGGVMRSVWGAAIIHRPYFEKLDSSLSRQEIDARYKAMAKDVGDYLEEMNVPRALGDTMMTIPPEEAHILTTDELRSYMLNQTDPGYDEILTAAGASSYDLTSAGYRARDAKAYALCPHYSRSDTPEESKRKMWCKEGILWNVPPSLLPAREETFTRLRDDPQFLALTPEAQRACRIAVYRDGASSCP